MKNTLMSVVLLLSATQTFAQSDLFGRNADTGAIVGGIVGAVVGHHNGNAWKGAAIGAGVGLAAGAIADNNQYRHQQVHSQVVYGEPRTIHDSPSFDDYYNQPRTIYVPPPRVVYTQPHYGYSHREVVVVQQPIVIEQRVWSGSGCWVYSYHGYRDNRGHTHYRSNTPFQRRYEHSRRR